MHDFALGGKNSTMSPIRVISGQARGRRLKMVPGDSTRPIGDKVKQALFNIIGPDIQESRFLDLFAGTGSVGIEALSRGAEWVLFNDADTKAIKTIRENLEHTALLENNEILQRDAQKLLTTPCSEPYDYVFVAPPQFKTLWLETLKILDNDPHWLNPDAWVITQIHPDELQDIELANLIEFDRRKYGNTMLLFYEWPSA
jgi:16S rRNA (guanine(966)-N(2))-methyltransferase RsmD